MFSILRKTTLTLSGTLKLSSENAFNLGKPKILSSGNGLKVLVCLFIYTCRSMLIYVEKEENLAQENIFLRATVNAIFTVATFDPFSKDTL